MYINFEQTTCCQNKTKSNDPVLPFKDLQAENSFIMRVSLINSLLCAKSVHSTQGVIEINQVTSLYGMFGKSTIFRRCMFFYPLTKPAVCFPNIKFTAFLTIDFIHHITQRTYRNRTFDLGKGCQLKNRCVDHSETNPRC